MPSQTVTVGSAVGLHARPAALIAEAVSKAGVPVTLATPGGNPVDAGSPLMIMTLGAKKGAEVTVTTSASDWQRWRATVGSTTPGLTASKYRLTTAPGLTAAEQVAFTGGARWTLAVRGDATQPVVRAGSPAVWSYCS